MRAKRLLVVPLVIAVACKPPTPAEQMDSVISWLGTAGMAGDAWLRHTTPDKYTRQTLDLAHQTMQRTADDLLKSPPSAVDSATLDSALTSARTHVAQMARLVDAKDAPDFRRELDSMRAAEKFVKQLADSIEEKQ
ncbi:MAG: hypothetical protein ACJ79I_06780 [Gemmatimonadaceae bacterium]